MLLVSVSLFLNKSVKPQSTNQWTAVSSSSVIVHYAWCWWKFLLWKRILFGFVFPCCCLMDLQHHPDSSWSNIICLRWASDDVPASAESAGVVGVFDRGEWAASDFPDGENDPLECVPYRCGANKASQHALSGANDDSEDHQVGESPQGLCDRKSRRGFRVSPEIRTFSTQFRFSLFTFIFGCEPYLNRSAPWPEVSDYVMGHDIIRTWECKPELFAVVIVVFSLLWASTACGFDKHRSQPVSKKWCNQNYYVNVISNNLCKHDFLDTETACRDPGETLTAWNV